MSINETELNAKAENHNRIKKLVETGNEAIRIKKVKTRRAIEDYKERKLLESSIAGFDLS